MKNHYLYFISLFLIFSLNCNSEEEKILYDKELRHWDYVEIGSTHFNPVHGICFQKNRSAYRYINDLTDSVRYIIGKGADLEYWESVNVYINWELNIKDYTITIDNMTYDINIISKDRLVIYDKINGQYTLVPSSFEFPENWDLIR